VPRYPAPRPPSQTHRSFLLHRATRAGARVLARAAPAELLAHEGALGAAALRVALRRVRERLYLGMFLARALPPPHARDAGSGAAAAGAQPSPRAGALAGSAPAPPSPAAPQSPRDAHLAGPAGPSIEL
jgi:hypothetical protein